MQEKIKIRSLQTAEEYRACQELQMKVWGLPELRCFLSPGLTAILNGGMLLSATMEELVGFLLWFCEAMRWETIICSHMLAVLPDYRGRVWLSTEAGSKGEGPVPGNKDHDLDL